MASVNDNSLKVGFCKRRGTKMKILMCMHYKMKLIKLKLMDVSMPIFSDMNVF